MQNVLVSFILPAYKGKFIRQAIDSILAQTYQSFELVVVDDCSPDNIGEIVGEYSDSRIIYYRNDKNLGGDNLVKQWNHSIKYARGQYLVLAADDDEYHPDFLKQMVDLALKYPLVDVVRSRVSIINEKGEMLDFDGLLPQFTSKYQYQYYWQLGTSITCIGNFMFKTSVMQEKEFIDLPCAYGSDVISVINMAENGVANTQDLLFRFRISSVHLSSDRTRLKERLEAVVGMYTWLKARDYDKPNDELNKLCYQRMQWDVLYSKYIYDCYNQSIKFTPPHMVLKLLKNVWSLPFLSFKDRILMTLRYFFDRILK